MLPVPAAVAKALGPGKDSDGKKEVTLEFTAVEVARRTMPHPDGLAGDLPGILTVLGPAGATLLGAMADLELAQQSGRLRAARVMAAYEHAATEAVRSWYTSTPSPNVVRTNNIQPIADGGPERRDSGRVAPDAGATPAVSGGQAGTPPVPLSAGLAMPAVVPGTYAHSQVGRPAGLSDRKEGADVAADGVGAGAAIGGDSGVAADPALTRQGAATVGAPVLPSAVPASAAAPSAAASVWTGAQPTAYTQPAVVSDRWVRIDADTTAPAPVADPAHRTTWTDIEAMDTAAPDYVVGAGSGGGGR